DDCLRVGDRFEAGLHFEVKREGSVVRGVRRVGREVKPAASGFIGTSTLDDDAGLAELPANVENPINLISAGERTAVQQDYARGIHVQQEAGGFEHDFHYEVVLCDREFDV